MPLGAVLSRENAGQRRAFGDVYPDINQSQRGVLQLVPRVCRDERRPRGAPIILYVIIDDIGFGWVEPLVG
jgi:hypothetical protein